MMKDSDDIISLKKRFETSTWSSESNNESEGGTRKNTPDDNKDRQLNTKLQYYNVRYGDVNAKVRDLIIHEKKLLVKKLERKLKRKLEQITPCAESGDAIIKLRRIHEKYTTQLEKGTVCRSPLKKLQRLEFQDVLWAHQGKYNSLVPDPGRKSHREITDAVFFGTKDGTFIYLLNRDKVIKAPKNKEKNPDHHKD